MVLKVTCAWLQPFLIHVVTYKNSDLSSTFYLGHMVNQQRIIISPFPRFLYFYATKKYISAHIYTNYYSLKGHKMVFNALTYYLLSGDCLSFLSYLLFLHIQSFSIQPCIYLDFAFVRLANSHNYFIGEKI